MFFTGYRLDVLEALEIIIADFYLPIKPISDDYRYIQQFGREI